MRIFWHDIDLSIVAGAGGGSQQSEYYLSKGGDAGIIEGYDGNYRFTTQQ